MEEPSSLNLLEELKEYLDFSEEIKKEPELEQFIKEAQDHCVDELLNQDIQDTRPEIRDNLTSQIILCNLPILEQEKEHKFKEFLIKIFTGFELVIDQAAINIPFKMTEQGLQSQGLAFVTMKNEEEAYNAAELVDGAKIGKENARCLNFEEFERIIEIPDKYELPIIKQESELLSWMLDINHFKEQLVIRYDTKLQKETTIIWFNPVEKKFSTFYDGSTQKEEGRCWTDRTVVWSPNGRYLASLHTRGVALWGGNRFDRLNRFPHKNVRNLSFSPDEKFLLTYNGKSFIIWNTFTAQNMRTFVASEDVQWGAFQWNFDGTLLSKQSPSSIIFYQIPEMSMLPDISGKKTAIKVQSLKQFSWSPKHQYIAYLEEKSPNVQNSVNSIKIQKIPEREVLASKSNLMSEYQELKWSPDGNFLASYAYKKSQAKNIISSTIYLFQLTAKNVPCETYEVQNQILQLQWAANSRYFGILSKKEGDKQTLFQALNVDQKGQISPIDSILCPRVDQIHWAPQGTHLVLFSTSQNIQENLQFLILNDNDPKNKPHLDKINSIGHDGCNKVQWDPSGRFLLTTASDKLKDTSFSKKQNQLQIWTFHGTLKLKQTFDHKFYQALWRPRKQIQLNEAQLQEISKQADTMSVSFKEKSKEEKFQIQKQNLQDRIQKRDWFMAKFKQRQEKIKSEGIKLIPRNINM